MEIKTYRYIVIVMIG